MSPLVKTKRQANFKNFKRFGAFKGLVEELEASLAGFSDFSIPITFAVLNSGGIYKAFTFFLGPSWLSSDFVGSTSVISKFPKGN
jgi:hypothetical protein